MEDQEFARLWRHVKTLEAASESHERALSGIHYTLFGVPEMPGSGFVHELPRRIQHVERQLTRMNQYLAGLLATGIIAVAGELIVRVTNG